MSAPKAIDGGNEERARAGHLNNRFLGHLVGLKSSGN
jgi:hypothetical protein